ncbi:type II toxin-antitoxin system RelE/ParE family toxin [Beijerinckia sp. L45]|uniref:type II toxin-antitoxin system RelE/ParE family toxin n=1 Tax=Beijerinckia sp. L45 TaxID=1641855 RepID=UPI001FED41C1|nr:type II toxin-antitoxin system RelE/ParE family toxin [Beijerinckia sp. L45]
MTLKLKVRTSAQNDLLEIWRFVAVNDADAADRLLDRIDKVFAMLADHALAGRARPELGAGVRSFPTGSYIVFYRYDDGGTIDVVRVLSGFLDFGDDDFL